MKTEQRAEEARRILAEPMLIEAFSTVESGLVAAMKSSKLGDPNTHHELVLCLQLLGRVRGFFDDVINTGRMDEMQRKFQGY